MRKLSTILFLTGLVFSAVTCQAQDAEVLFGFEDGLQGWDVPEWAYEKPDHVQKEIGATDTVASEGKQSLGIDASFPGGSWAGAIVEVIQYMDWSDYSAIACDVYLPEDAPTGLKGKMILTVGDTWKWVEMSKDVSLVPGEWVTIEGNLLPGSIDWRRVQVDEAFRSDIRKLDVRVVSNGKPAYTGMFYVDNIRGIK